MTPLLSSTC